MVTNKVKKICNLEKKNVSKGKIIIKKSESWKY